MAVMGDASAEVWAEELRRTGRVVFPVRRLPVVARFAFFSLPFLSSLLSAADRWEQGGTARVMSFIGVAGFLMLVGVYLWQFLSGRPALTVDQEGIRLGRRIFMPWTEVGTIGLPTGPTFLQSIPILPNDVWAKELRIPQENVRDVVALAHWLEEVLREQRRQTKDLGREHS